MTTTESGRVNWQAGMTQEERSEAFGELFFDEVESWFASSIACCDGCHDDFVDQWPNVYSTDSAIFQCNSIDLGVFYSGSRLTELYTQEEFHELVPSVRCPNCGRPLSANIWPYELPFSLPDGYRTTLSEIAKLASQTPFLLLEHPFCVKVRDAIENAYAACAPTSRPDFFYRGRSLSPGSSVSVSDFDFPPADVVKEGRYNHAGDPVLYLACTEDGCRTEMRFADHLRIAKFKMPVPMRVLNLIVPHDTESDESNTLRFIVYSALLSARSNDKGFCRPEYVFSRFIKDCARHMGFDAIFYPSTRVATACANLVVINREMTLRDNATEIGFYSA